MPKDLSGAQVGMAPQNNVNNPRPNGARGRNTFPLFFKHLTTDRYADFSPFFCIKAERGDVHSLNTHHDLHTFTLKSPMVGNVNMRKSYIKVPMYSIYPRNWEKMLTIPTQGDDVPETTRAKLDVRSLVESLLLEIGHDYAESSVSNSVFVRKLLLLEAICSDGGLLSRFNIHLNHIFYLGTQNGDEYEANIDTLCDLFFWPAVLGFAESNGIFVKGDGDSQILYKVSSSPRIDGLTHYVSKRRFLELLRNEDVVFTSGWLSSSSLQQSVASFFLLNNQGFVPDSSDSDRFINIEPLIAYQLACAQFGTNDFVDFIYSAQLYRDNQQGILLSCLSELPWFLYNGIYCLYDVFSQKVFDDLLFSLRTAPLDESTQLFNNIWSYFYNIFQFQQSLRYGDYFTGAKPQPLAVGEYSAQVSSDNSVSAIDITRSIQMQRLLHRVNMVGRKIGDYLSGIFGGQIPEAPKDVPVFLAHQSFGVGGFQTENTGDAQFAENTPNIITSQLRASESKHAFEIEIDEPCYIIGLTSYQSERIYSRTMDRFAFHYDRYDDFIPEMQYIGDQDIRQTELLGNGSSLPFGYALRYMEYKQRVSYASGGFIRNLPSWALITDNSDGNPAINNINPMYIRSSSSEFDRFYKSLTGYSLGSYFHFIVANSINDTASRMMEYTPEILK